MLRFQFLTSNATLPTRSHGDDAGLDIYTCSNGTIEPGRVTKIPTGICVVIPFDCYGLLCGRSGHAIFNNLIIISGIIDSGYRGEINIMALNLGKQTYAYNKGERMAQMIVQPLRRLTPQLDMDYADETTRSVFGFGSTGIFRAALL